MEGLKLLDLLSLGIRLYLTDLELPGSPYAPAAGEYRKQTGDFTKKTGRKEKRCKAKVQPEGILSTQGTKRERLSVSSFRDRKL